VIESASTKVRIWDLPTRLFHWLLAALVVYSFTTGKLGGDWLTWHFRSGYAIASLLLFRLLWGFAGSRYARFASFLPSPSGIWRTLHSQKVIEASAGHSAIGTLSVFTLLIVLLAQVIAGMFTNDGTFIEGPWVKFVSSAISDRFSTFHYYNGWLVVAFVAVHVDADRRQARLERDPCRRWGGDPPARRRAGGDRRRSRLLRGHVTRPGRAGQTVAVLLASACWRRRSSCALSSGVNSAPKSSASNTWRSSTSAPPSKGARFSHSIASCFERTCHSQ
jgi:cytochrome b